MSFFYTYQLFLRLCFQESKTGSAAFGDGQGGTGFFKNIASVYLAPKEMLSGGRCGGRKAVAFAITLTKDGPFMDGAIVLGASLGKVTKRHSLPTPAANTHIMLLVCAYTASPPGVGDSNPP